jgi:hypothetical protein
VEIHSSARRHDVVDEDIAHAYERAIAWLRLDDDPTRYLLAGPTEPATSSNWSYSKWRAVR